MKANASQMQQNRKSADHKSLEEGSELLLDFFKLAEMGSAAQDGLVPTVVQNVDSGEVLILAYVNEEALKESLEQKIAVFFSTSRRELWIKGATSGDYLDLLEVRINCEQNSLLYLVRPRAGGVCHTRDDSGQTRSSCYYRKFDSSGLSPVANGPLPWHDNSK
ncbi:MAG: phosphoribosyl-AMP cyclohydrolase [Leptospiraceae bacterium]